MITQNSPRCLPVFSLSLSYSSTKSKDFGRSKDFRTFLDFYCVRRNLMMESPCHSARCVAGKRSAQEASQEIPRGCPQCCSRILTLLDDEIVFRSLSDQMAFEISTQSPQLSVWRDRVAQWYYNVVDHLGVPRDVVYLAMNFLDRISAINSANRMMTKEEYELSSTTCIFLAMRVTSNRTDLKVSDLLQLCESRLQVTEIQTAGTRLLRCLSMKTPMITPSTFVKAYIQLLQSMVSCEDASSLLETSLYLTELSVCDHSLSRAPASELAFAAVLACVKSDHVGAKLELNSQEEFLKALEDETCLSLTSSEIQFYYDRIVANYNQSWEGISHVTSVVIHDEPDISRPCHPQDSSESLISLLPWTPTVSNLRGLEMSRPKKRSRMT